MMSMLLLLSIRSLNNEHAFRFVPGWYSYKAYSTSTWVGPVAIYVFFPLNAVFQCILASKAAGWVFRQEKAEGEFRFAHASVRTQVRTPLPFFFLLLLLLSSPLFSCFAFFSFSLFLFFLSCFAFILSLPSVVSFIVWGSI